MSVDSGLTECSVSYQWRFEAPLGLVGVATVDGRLLAIPEVADAPAWVGKLPAPVMAYTRVSRAGDGQGGFDHQPVPVARIERIVLHEAEMVALGSFGDTELARHYAGALALDAVAMAVNVHCPAEPEEQDGVLVYSGWSVAGVLIVKDSPWPVGSTSAPRVWQEKLTGP